MSKPAIFAALALILLPPAPPLFAEPIQLGGDIIVPLENRPELGLFVLGFVNDHGPYRFKVIFADRTCLTPTAVMEAGLATKKTGVVFDAMSKGLRDALAVQAAEIRIGDKALNVDNVCVMSDRDLNAYTPVRAFGGNIGIELMRASFVTIDGARSRMRFASSSPGEAGEVGSAMISLDDSTTNGTTTRLVDPLPGIDAMLNGQDSRFRMELASGGLVFINTSKSGLNLIKTSPFRYQSLTWTPDGVTVFEHGAAVDVVLGGRHFQNVSIARVQDKTPFPLSNALDRFPVEGVIGLGLLGPVSFSIDNDAGAAWIGPAPTVTHLPDTAPEPNRPRKSFGLMPWLYKGRGVARAVDRGGPADLAGIAPGDEIVSINGVGVVEFYEHIDPKRKGPAPETVVFRNATGEHTAVLNPGLPELN